MLVAALTAAALRTAYAFHRVPRELRSRYLVPPFSLRGPRTLAYARDRFALPTAPREGVQVVEERAVARDGTPVRLVRLDPPGPDRAGAALLWIHGGGFVLGSADQETASGSALAADLGIVVVVVDYRLAPEHPFPAALEDCYAALVWLAEHAERLGVDRARIAVGGASAGGGLAASLCLLARDRGEVAPAFQVLRYPMLDDRTTLTRPGHRGRFVWTPRSNRYAWTSYLGRRPRAAGAPPYAVPARAADLGGLPPAWIGVGDNDLFLEEAQAYAARLAEAGVPVDLHVEPGMYHGADGLAAAAPSMRAFRAREVAALRAALAPATRR